jgi:hypothetical protein
MATVTGYLLVEGVHDLAVISRLLRQRGFAAVESYQALLALLPGSDWVERLVPKVWPVGDRLNHRHPVPSYFHNAADDVLVVEQVEGDSRLAERKVYVEREVGEFASLRGWGIMLDCDDSTPAARLAELRKALPALPASLAPGTIHPGPPRIGVHVLPDNRGQGTLEDILLAAAERVYPRTLEKARHFVATVRNDQDAWPGREWTAMNKPSGPKKATIAAVTAILKPGRTTSVSVSDHAWVTPATTAATDLRHLDDFLNALLLAPPSTPATAAAHPT